MTALNEIGSGSAERFDLSGIPDRVNLVDGRPIPVRHNPTGSIDHGKPVVGIHGGNNGVVSLSGAEIGAHVKK